MEESKKEEKLEDVNFFEEIALESQFPKISIASVNRLKEINYLDEECKEISFSKFWNIHKNSKWITASQVAFLFLIENNFFTNVFPVWFEENYRSRMRQTKRYNFKKVEERKIEAT